MSIFVPQILAIVGGGWVGLTKSWKSQILFFEPFPFSFSFVVIFSVYYVASGQWQVDIIVKLLVAHNNHLAGAMIQLMSWIVNFVII